MEIEEALQEQQWRDILWPMMLIVVAWGLILIAFATNQTKLIDHDYLLRSSHWPWLLALGVFLVMWQVMTIAMMLPALLPLFPTIASEHRNLSSLWIVQGAFVAGFALVWTGFALLAFLSDTLIHRVVTEWFWLYTHTWVIGAVTLALAGGFQFCAFKQRCLQQCCIFYNWHGRSRQYDRRTAWIFGIHYGYACIGSCWALMLVMFGLGMKSLLWIALLASVIALEKGVPGGQRLRVGIGALFLLLAAGWSLFFLQYPQILQYL